MSEITAEPARESRSGVSGLSGSNNVFHASLRTSDPLDVSAADLTARLSENERDLLLEVVRALVGIRFGSVVLTVHDGRLAEIEKTERIRRKAARQGT
jgi:hypothetical protein